ncbi:MAG: threonine synthase [Acidimicrobiia bacterium]|nr:threonine synthase [Acidimicrobiia bacterium]NNF09448.1 threonine synthase [Acidimicrobiia bacterium]NNL70040.1 threonine synthase [Acidimicrobiia bacterium]
MRYESTRGGVRGRGFSDVLLEGLAPDGGLYVPESVPRLEPATWHALAGRSWSEIATEVMLPFVEPDYERDELAALVERSYTRFTHPEVAPLRVLDSAAGEWLLELFWGPTLAFKDVALQLLGNLFERELARRSNAVTVIGATSGDTGSAAIEALRSREGIELFMLHPRGRVSEVQRRQMTTVDDANIHNLAIEGTFDDCQDLVKAMFADEAFRSRHALSAVNSINWARVMAQTVYYASAALHLGAPASPVAFSVPTGNFGNIYAGHVARQMGVPISQLILATNVNDILSRAFDSGSLLIQDVAPSTSPAMDIQISSNFERLLFELYGRDGPRLAAVMERFRLLGHVELAEDVLEAYRELFDADRLDDDGTRRVIADVYQDTGIVVDPHTAVGVGVGRSLRADGDVPLVMLACAHPAKFPETVAAALGEAPIPPDRIQGLAGLPEQFDVLPNDLNAVMAYIEEHSVRS